MDALITQSALMVDNLVLRTATEEAEINHLRQALNQEHYLKAGRPAGHVLWQGIYRTDTETDCPELVAVLSCHPPTKPPLPMATPPVPAAP